MNPCFCSAGRKTRQIHRIVRSNPLQQRRWNSGGNTSPTEKTGGNKLVDRSKAFVIGSIAGTCGSLAGMGGGFIMIPLMTSKRILGLTQHQAHATSLFAVATTGLAGAVSYSSLEEENNVDARVAAAIALSGMATASLGAHASARLSQKRLGLGLGIFMLLVAPTIPARDYLLELQPKDLSSKISTESGDDSVVGSWQRYVKASAIGCFSGFLAGMFGVGGGAVVVPALSLFMDMNHYQALGTSLCAMVPTAVVGTATHMSKGTVALRIAPALALGAFTGGLVGGKLGLSIPEQELKYGFSGTMVVLGLRTILKV